MYRQAIILILSLVLIFMLAYKQNWNPFAVDGNEDTELSVPAVSEEMQKAFDAGQGVWLVFSSDTWPACVELDKIAGPVRLEYKEKVAYIKVDVNDSNNRELLQQYPVSYIPASFIMDKNGKLSFSAVGVLKQDEIRAELDKVVSN